MPETLTHVFVFDDLYDGRCIYCDCRAWGIHASKPCERPLIQDGR